MADARLPTPDELRKLLDYDEDAGSLMWKPRPAGMFKAGARSADWAAANWNAKYAGKPAFTAKTCDGYCHGRVFGKTLKSHRVIWAMVTGKWPAGEIDHISGDRSDNRLKNLRDATSSENSRNTKRRCDNSSGVTGVYLDARCGKWQAQIEVEGRKKSLGYFTDFADAVSARAAAEAKHGFHPGHGRR